MGIASATQRLCEKHTQHIHHKRNKRKHKAKRRLTHTAFAQAQRSKTHRINTENPQPLRALRLCAKFHYIGHIRTHKASPKRRDCTKPLRKRSLKTQSISIDGHSLCDSASLRETYAAHSPQKEQRKHKAKRN